MNPFDRQTEILNELAQNLHSDADCDYETALYEFTYIPDYKTIENYFEFHRNSQKINRGSSDQFSWNNYLLAKELREIMKAHTGGEWNSFTLTLDADGKAHTKFHYPEAKPE
jgi:hypothetical protein